MPPPGYKTPERLAFGRFFARIGRVLRSVWSYPAESLKREPDPVVRFIGGPRHGVEWPVPMHIYEIKPPKGEPGTYVRMLDADGTHIFRWHSDR